MKKAFPTLNGVLAVLVISATVYYEKVVDSDGTKTIRYIEPEENHQSLSGLATIPTVVML